MLGRTLTTALLAASVATTASAQLAQWSQVESDYFRLVRSPGVPSATLPLTTEQPGKRFLPGLAGMPSTSGLGSDGVLLFGGRESKPSGPYLNDTWFWDGSAWFRIQTGPTPKARESAHMAYDLLRNEAVLFSGWDGNNYVNDTWTFDGAAWSQKSLATQPPGRDWAGMTYDLSNFETVLFGGHIWQNVVAGLGQEGDTWTWDGTQWTNHTGGLAVSPPSRSRHALAFDGNTGTVILFGGTSSLTTNDMWSWDGTAWTELTPPTLPPGRLDPQMEWDLARQKLVLHGGAVSGALSPSLSDTWEWDGATWTQTATNGPGVSATELVYDLPRARMVLFGGATVTDKTSTLDETWVYGL